MNDCSTNLLRSGAPLLYGTLMLLPYKNWLIMIVSCCKNNCDEQFFNRKTLKVQQFQWYFKLKGHKNYKSLCAYQSKCQLILNDIMCIKVCNWKYEVGYISFYQDLDCPNCWLLFICRMVKRFVHNLFWYCVNFVPI